MRGLLDELPLGADFLDPRAIEDPHRLFAELRERDPMHWSERHKGWVLSCYDDVVDAYDDPRLSSERVRPLLRSLSPERRAEMAPLLELIADWMVVTDPPKHTRLRRLAGRAFNPRRLAALEPRVTAIVDELLGRFLERGEGDFVAEVAYPLPATVIAEVLGVPGTDRDQFRAWSDELALVAFGAAGDERPERHARALRGLRELLSYLHDLILAARSRGGEDMLAALWEGDGSGDVLTLTEMQSLAALMLFAGHETTTNLLSRMALAFCEFPDQYQRLRQSPDLVNSAVEEVLRYDGPVKVLIRWVTEDHLRRGKEVKAGQRVLIGQASANRDPARFAFPDALDVGRAPNPHIAFGRGIHACIGAQLARMEGRAALAGLVRRVESLELLEDRLQWLPSLASRSLTRLVIRCRPASRRNASAAVDRPAGGRGDGLTARARAS